jgi:hypothetical protein
VANRRLTEPRWPSRRCIATTIQASSAVAAKESTEFPITNTVEVTTPMAMSSHNVR